MNTPTRQERLARTRRHRTWANANQLNVATADASSVDGSIQDDNEERKQKLREKVTSPRFLPTSPARKTSATDAATPGSPASSSQDHPASSLSSPSVASRRQRMQEISMKTSLKSRTPTSSSSPKAGIFRRTNETSSSSSSETNHHNNHHATAMANPDERKEEATIIPQGNSISQRIKSFDRGDVVPSPSFSRGSWNQQQHKYKTHPQIQANAWDIMETASDASSALPPPPPPEPVNKFKSWSQWEQKNRNLVGNKNNRPATEQPSVETSSVDGSSTEPPSPATTMRVPPKAGRVVVYPSPTARSPSPVAQQPYRGVATGRVVVPRSPTPSVCSVDSSFSAQKQSSYGTSRHSWNSSSSNNNNATPPTKIAVGPSPKAQRSFVSPVKYGSQPKAAGGRKSTDSQGSIYKNLLKPVQKETNKPKKSHEVEAYGAIIETPQKSSVSSLHAMFDSQKSSPLMPMNSPNNRARHSLPLSTKSPSSIKSGGGGVAARYRSAVVERTETTIPSAKQHVVVEEPKTAPSLSRQSSSSPRHPVVATPWSQGQSPAKQETKPVPAENSRVRQYYNASWRVQNPEEKKDDDDEDSNESTISSQDMTQATESTTDQPKPTRSVVSAWQDRLKPRRIDMEVPDSPILSDTAKAKEAAEVPTKKRVDPAAVSPAMLSSLMFATNKKKDVDTVKAADPEVKAPPKRVEPKDVSSSVLASLMYSSEKKKADEEKPKTLPEPVAIDWPSDSSDANGHHDVAKADEAETEVISNSTDVPETESHDDLVLEQESPTNASRGSNQPVPPSNVAKPWDNDTKHSVVQSWQMRTSSRSKDTSSSSLPATESHENRDIVQSGDGTEEKEVAQVQGSNSIKEKPSNDQLQQALSTNSYVSSFLEEKKSGDLSIDEDAILGADVDGHPIDRNEYRDPSAHPVKNPSFYDDDSYLSRGDTLSHHRDLAASASFKSASGRINTTRTYNSEDMSVYVEDERIITEKEDEILSAQFEQMNLEITTGIQEENGETAEPAQSGLVTPRKERPNIPLINPSPKDNDQYRVRYFEDAGVSTPNAKNGVPVDNHHDAESVKSRRSTDIEVFDVWASSVASNEERNEAIKFDQTDQWLDRDPEIEDSLAVEEDPSEESDVFEQVNQNDEDDAPPENNDPPRPIGIKKPPESLRTLQRMKATTPKKQKNEPPKQEVFDPFGFDAEEAGGLTIEVAEDLFSSNPDPFATEDQFSPLEWSSPRGSSGRKASRSFSNDAANPQQHIGYYNSPDSRIEI